MRIESVRIENFRAFKDETVYLNPYTALLGPNGGGKSTVLTALNVFYRYSMDAVTNLVLLDEEDFHNRDVSSPIIITVTFADLGPDAQKDFAAYYRQGKLIVSAKAQWNSGTRCADVKQFGQRLVIKEFAGFFIAEGDGAKVEDLKKHYAAIRTKHTSLPAPGTKQVMLDALHDYETAHPAECELVPSEDQFYGISKGKNLLEKYIQWIFVPAVKDATAEQLEARKTALGLILERTVRSKVSFSQPLSDLRQRAMADYQKILADRESLLATLSASLTSRFQDWAHPDAKVRLRWHSDIDSAVKLADPLAEVITREGIFEGQLARFGHGLQRSFILALLQELAPGDATNAAVLVLGCEEPELYQHPPQVRHVASVFQRLAQTGAQILVCTHSPLFVHGEGFEDVRLICRDSKTQAAKVHSVKFDAVAKIVADATGNRPSPKQGAAMKVAQALQPTLNEMFFTSVLVLVEGLEDAGYIASYLALTDRWEEYRRLGCHIVPASGKHSMIQTLAIANLLEIPTFTLFDGDTDKINKPELRVKHESDNAALLKIAGYPAEAPLPTANVWKDSLVMWTEDIGSALAADIGKAEWENLHNRVKKELQIIDVADLHKNVIFIGELLASAWNAGMKFPTLDKLCDAILNFARSQRLAKKVAG